MTVPSTVPATVCFRVDASTTIGSGHFMRCLTLAAALRSRGVTCRFITRAHEGTLAGLARSLGFDVVELPLGIVTGDETRGDYASWIGGTWDEDARQTRDAIGPQGAAWIVVDHYGLDDRWESAVRDSCERLLVIDDLADRPHDCDLLLDQNLIAGMQSRYDGLVPDSCGLVLGSQFVLLQPDYAELHDRMPPREGAIARVLVYFGGADRQDLTGKSLRALVAIGREDLAIDVVINPESPFAPGIRDLAGQWPQIVVHERKKSLAALMVRADLALGAGGATSWERCCLGLPTLLVTLAANQRPIARELDRRGLARWIGDVDSITAPDFDRALRSVLSEPLVPDWSRRAAAMVDGRGADRVCAYLTLHSETPLSARFATVEDEALTFDWANDRLSRQNAFSPELIPAEVHHQWYRSRLRDLDNCAIFILTASDEVPVGQVRFDRRQQGWEISYMLDSRCRGRGLGVMLLRAAMAELKRIDPDAICFGKVKSVNTASRRVFERLGFACEIKGDVVTYSLDPTGQPGL